MTIIWHIVKNLTANVNVERHYITSCDKYVDNNNIKVCEEKHTML